MTDQQLFDLALGAVVKHVRKRKKLTQEALGKRVGMAQSTIARIERGSLRLAAGDLKALGRALGWNAERLWSIVHRVEFQVKQAACAITPEALTRDGDLRDGLDPTGIVQFAVAATMR